MNQDLRNEVVNVCLSNIKEQEVATWFSEKLSTVDKASAFYLSFGMINKKIGRNTIELSPKLQKMLIAINPVFDNTSWTHDEFCRLALLLTLPTESNVTTIKTLLSSADIRELVILYKSIQYLNNPDAFLLPVIDGLRTNMVDVFDAISANNSYPLRFFEESSWNQMVLKAIFMERPIFNIYGIDERRNESLAGILHDFVHERWSAHRPVTPELWRMMVGFTNTAIFEDLKKTLGSDSHLSKTAALKVLEDTNFDEATRWLSSQQFESANTTWDEIGRQVFSDKN